jgi:hypothetical protein
MDAVKTEKPAPSDIPKPSGGVPAAQDEATKSGAVPK